MANDRLFIKCDDCGGWKMLMKHFPGNLSTRDNGILKWLDEHGRCHPNLYNLDLGGITGFSLHTENECRYGGKLLPEKQNSLPIKPEGHICTVEEGIQRLHKALGTEDIPIPLDYDMPASAAGDALSKILKFEALRDLGDKDDTQ